MPNKSNFEMEPFKTSNGLYNLQIIDRDPNVKNIEYMGINEAVKNKIYQDFINTEISYLHFRYDLGEVLTSKEMVHSLIFQEYESFDDMEYGPDPDADNTQNEVITSSHVIEQNLPTGL